MHSLTLLLKSSLTLSPWATHSVIAIAQDPDATLGNQFFVLCAAVSDSRSQLCVYAAQTNSGSTPVLIADLSSYCRADDIVAFHYLPDVRCLCIACGSGKLIRLSLDNQSFSLNENCAKIEIVAEVCIEQNEDGIAAAKWSPCDSFAVLVTRSRRLLLLSMPSFDLVAEHPLDDNKELQAPVSVGWGRKETQFHGSLGKAAARDSPATIASLAPDDDHAPRISWRGDSAFFVISCIIPSKDCPELLRRALRVYRTGISGYDDYALDHSAYATLMSISEPVDSLMAAPLAWRPSGELITTCRGSKIIFFERNGLRHGEFNLCDQESSLDCLETVVGVLWNSDSSLLLVQCAECLQVWSTNNYHWYLKAYIPLSNDAGTLVRWDLQNPLILHFVHDSILWTYQWTRDVLGEPTSLANRSLQCAVCVVDGSTLLHTPLLIANVPPPYSLSKLKCRRPIQCAAISCKNNDVVVYDGESLLFWKPIDSRLSSFSLQSSEIIDQHASLRQLVYLGEGRVAFLKNLENTDILLVLENGCNVIDNLPLGSCRALRLIPCTSYAGDLLVELDDGSVQRYVSETKRLLFLCRLPVPCEQIDSYYSTSLSRIVVVGKSTDFKLFVDTRLISSECISFCLHSEYLIYTTLSHKAWFIRLQADDFQAVASRNVERGSVIIGCHYFGTGLLLQMPRGNLETVYPRALVLDVIIRQHLNHGAPKQQLPNWREAFLMCRRHRVDMNILVDANSDLFFEQVPHFVTSLGQPDYLNLFLTGIKNSNVFDHDANGIYKEFAFLTSKEATKVKGSKVNRVCMALYQELNGKSDEWISTILTTLVKSDPPETEKALELCRDTDSNAHDVKAALEYITFLVDPVYLYDVALGMYDFQLVLDIAQHTQKDPREYLPFLQELRDLPKYVQRYRVDTYLARHQKAFESLMKQSESGEEFVGSMNVWEEIVAVLGKHRFYRQAIKFFTLKRAFQRRDLVVELYGQYLEKEEKKYREAGIAYEMAGKPLAASRAYASGLHWQAALNSIEQCRDEERMDSKSLAEFAMEMVNRLQEVGRHQEAARLLKHECINDLKGALRSYIAGGHWEEALECCRVNPEWRRSEVLAGLRGNCQQQAAEIVEIKEDILARVARLKEYQEGAKKQREALRMVGEQSGDDEDTASECASLNSTFTGLTLVSKSSRRTTASGRSYRQRREERKRHQGRRGTIYEEEYLVRTLAALVKRAVELGKRVMRNIEELLRFGIVEQAQKLQSMQNDLQENVVQMFKPVNLHPPLESHESNVIALYAELGENLINAEASFLDHVLLVPQHKPSVS